MMFRKPDSCVRHQIVLSAAIADHHRHTCRITPASHVSFEKTEISFLVNISYYILVTCTLSALLTGLAGAAQYVTAQQNGFSTEERVSITVSGRVIQDLSVQNITIDVVADVNLVAEDPDQSVIEIDPTEDAVAFDTEFAGVGYVVAKGEPDTEFLLSFPRTVELTSTTDGSLLIIEYVVAHNSANEQQGADYVREVTQEFTLNSDGEYHFWLGGRVDISDVTDGDYEGEFFMDVEYKL